MTSTSSKKLKTGDDEVHIEAPSHGVPQEEADAHVEVPSNINSTAQHTASSLKKLLLRVVMARINAFYRTRDNFACIHKVLGKSLHCIHEGVGLVLWGDLKVLMNSPEVNDSSDVWKNQHTWSIQSWKLYSFSGVHVLETVSGLVFTWFVDKWYSPGQHYRKGDASDHQLEFCHGKGGCYNKEWLVQEGTTLGKDSIKSVNGCDDLPKIIRLLLLVFMLSLSFVAAKLSSCYNGFSNSRSDEVWFKDVAVQSLEFSKERLLSRKNIVTTSRYVVPTGRVKVLAGRYVVPIGRVKKVPVVVFYHSLGKDTHLPTAKAMVGNKFIKVVLNAYTASSSFSDQFFGLYPIDLSRIRTDKSKITRKQSKASKHGHENQKSTKPKPKEAKPQPKP
ncbi:hypothetical protein Tco_0140469 [Tanacetum coccineum]